MTRFARARGSKSSNERQPEEATSWSELKKQMVQQQSESENNSKDDPKSRFLLQKNEANNKTIKWAEFEETPFPTIKKKEKKKINKKDTAPQSGLELSDQEKLGRPSKKDKMHQVEKKSDKSLKTKQILAKTIKRTKNVIVNSGDEETIVKKVTLTEKVSKRENRTKKRKTATLDAPIIADINLADTSSLNDLVEVGSVDGGNFKLSKKQLKRKKHLQKKHLENGYISKSTNASNVPSNDNLEESNVVSTNGMPSKVKKIEVKDSTECREPKPSKRQLHRIKVNLKKKLPDRMLLASNVTSSGGTVESANQHGTVNTKLSKRQKRNLKQKHTKPISGTDSSTSLEGPKHASGHKRRKPNRPSETTTMLINGQEVEVTMFDGFPVRKQDAEHLGELRQKMIDNAVPLDEIKVAMKLERRKAEKALARERRKVCFHCRKAGHNLSECPGLEEGSNQDAGTMGICFKCGSTEHTHFECRVNRGEEYRFAKCFICQEQGHISRQCPDNPRGLYPKGGGCKVCGDVTHLKKDCPDLREEKEHHAITLETSRGDKLEALEEDLKGENSRPANHSHLNKIIKF